MNIRTLFLLLVSVLVVGCAGSVKPMSSEAVNEFNQGKVAVAYLYPSKKLNYTEQVYKVLWIENRANLVSFDGLWDIDTDISNEYQQQFKRLGVNAVVAKELLSATEYEHLQKDIALYQLKASEAIAASKTVPPLQLSTDYRDALAAQGAKYLILISQGMFNVQVLDLISKVTLISGSDVKVVDTRDGSITFDGDAMIWLNQDYQESPQEIEANNLQLLKSMVARGVNTQFEQNVLPKQMGLTQ
ncbi:hypothetical protein [Marinobacterium zhoushanense]|nr:hypothetical protein [Marinobacterium zhoushanense]